MDETTLIPKWTTDKQFRDIVEMMIYRAESYLREWECRVKREFLELAGETEAYLRREAEGNSFA